MLESLRPRASAAVSARMRAVSGGKSKGPLWIEVRLSYLEGSCRTCKRGLKLGHQHPRLLARNRDIRACAACARLQARRGRACGRQRSDMYNCAPDTVSSYQRHSRENLGAAAAEGLVRRGDSMHAVRPDLGGELTNGGVRAVSGAMWSLRSFLGHCWSRSTFGSRARKH